MDFDEYDYLEKTVENPKSPEDNVVGNGGDDVRKSSEKEHRSSRHEGGRDVEDARNPSKRSKHGDEYRENGRRDEKGLSHHRSSSRDVERSGTDRGSSRHRDRNKEEHEKERRERNNERDERTGREKNRDGDRERDRHRERTERDRDDRRERDKGKYKDRDETRSHRSMSRSERHHNGQDVENSQELERKEREKERPKERELGDRDRENRRHKDKKDAEPEADPERDQRTVFAYQICLKADERDVYEFFSRAGKVRDVRLIMDRNTRRSKGVGYIEFYDSMSVPMAIALSGQLLRGLPVMVKPSEAEKNLVQSTASAVTGANGVYSGGARRLYVGNLHFNMTEDQLRQVFEPFGTVELVQLPLDEIGRCKGFGFIQFSRLEDAKAAQSLNGQLEIAGRLIKVSAVTDQTGLQDAGANAADLDDDEGGGLSLNAQSRAMLMQKLDRTGATLNIANSFSAPAISTSSLNLPTGSIFGTTPIVPSFGQPPIAAVGGLVNSGAVVNYAAAAVVDPIGIPSECLLLKNMFDPSLETESDFELDIKEDVEDECSKFGKVKHIHVDRNSAGFVYLRFDSAQAAMNAQRALHGRWFAGKMITATFMAPQNYEAQFPSSA
uniref:RRM domain-containing protein n=1 Tax=Kalanchoe fedtschenkoi TaxID=63787 RepID=A0A7N0VAP5_KALFE